MSLKLYMDNHIHRAITTTLRERGVDVLITREDHRDRDADDILLARAAELGRLIFTHDADFLRLAHEWQDAGQPFPGVLYAHALDAPIGRTIDDLELIAKAGRSEEYASLVTYLPLR